MAVLKALDEDQTLGNARQIGTCMKNKIQDLSQLLLWQYEGRTLKLIKGDTVNNPYPKGIGACNSS